MLKAGFIGFGRMGITHFSILDTYTSVEIVVVCDRSETMLNIVKKQVAMEDLTDYSECRK